MHPLLHTRPIVGFENEFSLFQNAFNSKRLHHAWLISGQRSGKVIFAAALAKSILGPSIATHPDFLFVSANYETNSFNPKTSHTISVDEIRVTTRFMKKTAALSQYRIVLLDGADKITISGINALLKTLEEPGDNAVIFIVSRGALPATVRSRCIEITTSPLQKSEFCTLIDAPQEVRNRLFEASGARVGLAAEMLEIWSSLEEIDKVFLGKQSALDCMSKINHQLTKYRTIKEFIIFSLHKFFKEKAKAAIRLELNLYSKVLSLLSYSDYSISPYNSILAVLLEIEMTC